MCNPFMTTNTNTKLFYKNGGIEMKYISIALAIASGILSIFTICYILRKRRNSKETEA